MQTKALAQDESPPSPVLSCFALIFSPMDAPLSIVAMSFGLPGYHYLSLYSHFLSVALVITYAANYAIN